MRKGKSRIEFLRHSEEMERLCKYYNVFDEGDLLQIWMKDKTIESNTTLNDWIKSENIRIKEKKKKLREILK